jgi:hypothetical protein
MAIVKGKGTTLSVGGAAVPGIISIVPPSWSNDKIDVTSLASEWKECDSTLPDPQPITGIVNYDPAAHSALGTLAASGDIVAVAVGLPGGGGYSFQGFVSQWSSESVDIKGIHRRSFAIQPVGEVS